MPTPSHHQDAQRIRQLISAQLAIRAKADNPADTPLDKSCVSAEAWWLLGTQGCHLCDEAEKLLRLFSSVQPIPMEIIDIADFDDTLMMQFAAHIPVLLTPVQRLDYPFSIADLQQLYNN